METQALTAMVQPFHHAVPQGLQLCDAAKKNKEKPTIISRPKQQDNP
jgi:hypothetical protein